MYLILQETIVEKKIIEEPVNVKENISETVLEEKNSVQEEGEN